MCVRESEMVVVRSGVSPIVYSPSPLPIECGGRIHRLNASHGMLGRRVVHVVLTVGDSGEEPCHTPLDDEMVARLLAQTFLGERNNLRGFVSHVVRAERYSARTERNQPLTYESETTHIYNGRAVRRDANRGRPECCGNVLQTHG